MGKEFLVAALLIIFGCGVRAPKDSFMSGMTQEETSQTPVLMVLPNDDGILLSYKFNTRDLTEAEDFRMLRAVVARIEQLNADPTTEFSFDIEDKVVIFAYEGREVSVTVTADFGSDEVELWTGYNGKDWFVKKTYKGDPHDVLGYLCQGITGNPKVQEGKASEEPKTSLGKKTDCRSHGHFEFVLGKEIL